VPGSEVAMGRVITQYASSLIDSGLPPDIYPPPFHPARDVQNKKESYSVRNLYTKADPMSFNEEAVTLMTSCSTRRQTKAGLCLLQAEKGRLLDAARLLASCLYLLKGIAV
jgi:hypothetical protein